ncbi:hypothetical protein ACMD2_04082, partial [Ananas comosus]
GRSTNDVVQQVRRIISPVASSDDSPSNGVGSPRDFSAAGKALPAFSMVVDRRFPAFRDPRRGCGEGEVLPFPSLIRANSKVPGYWEILLYLSTPPNYPDAAVMLRF